MPISVKCPKCGGTVAAPDNLAGLTMPCAACGTNVYVPLPSATSSGRGAVVAVVLAVTLGGLFLCGGVVALVGYVFWLRASVLQESLGAVEAERMRANEALLEAEYQAARANAEEAQRAAELRMAIARAAIAETLANAGPAGLDKKLRLGLTLVQFASLNGALPSHASYSQDGRPLLSWRVHLLPLLGEQELYNEFHLDEAWDSEHNRALVVRMPDVFRCEGVSEEGRTCYVAPVGADTFFPPDPGMDRRNGVSKITLNDLPDPSMGRWIFVLKVPPEKAVVWTQPADWPYDAEQVEALFSEDGLLEAIGGDGWPMRFQREEADRVRVLLLRPARPERSSFLPTR